jgi:hypothetical protein
MRINAHIGTVVARTIEIRDQLIIVVRVRDVLASEYLYPSCEGHLSAFRHSYALVQACVVRAKGSRELLREAATVDTIGRIATQTRDVLDIKLRLLAVP